MKKNNIKVIELSEEECFILLLIMVLKQGNTSFLAIDCVSLIRYN